MSGPFDLAGHVAVVTGASTGLGLAIARGLASAGATVTINGRSEARLAAAVDALAHEGLAVSARAFDVTDPAGVREGIDAVAREHGAIDVLVNNAAINLRRPFDACTLDEWRSVMATNVDGAFLAIQAVLPSMKARRRGKIVNLCSLASDLGRPGVAAYATSKGAMRMLTRALAVELAPFNVQVNGISPGFFRTEMNAPLAADPVFSAWVERRTPAGRWGEPRDVAGAAVFLASSAADYVTGHLLHVDGGFAASY
ncbi:MAG: glucose 1-dehydrogenase [Proteobacteria bacterium]|jgi:gluconate 5-dehydrogenase|nr:glucose 1-dehydrogenase [Pseudomonadota bacterium]